MIPDVLPVSYHHALRHQPDKLTERRRPGGELPTAGWEQL